MTSASKKRLRILTCEVPRCNNTSLNKLRKFYTFPKDETRFRKWTKAICRMELLNKVPKHRRRRVCDVHFPGAHGARHPLHSNPNAVPTLHLPTKIFDDKKDKKDYGNQLPNTEVASTSASTSETRQVERGLPLPLREINNFRKELQKKNKAKRGYDRDFAVYALNLYLSCPKTYGVMWKILRLPNPKILKRADVGVGTKIGISTITTLESRIQKQKLCEKQCVLCLEEVELKQKLYYVIDKDEIIGFDDVNGKSTGQLADRALLLVLRGVCSGWTQPLGYFFLSDKTKYADIAAFIKDLTLKLHNLSGCTVVALVSALGPTFASIAEEFKITVETPSFPAKHLKVSFMYDLDQLFLMLRDTFIDNDIQFADVESGVEMFASWRDVEKFYEVDSSRAYPLAPQLTRSHIYPSAKEKEDVRLATQVFSRRVAAGMTCTHVESKSFGTVKFLGFLYDVYEVLTSTATKNVSQCPDILSKFSQCLSSISIRTQSGKENTSDTADFVYGLHVTLANVCKMIAQRNLERSANAVDNETEKAQNLCLKRFNLGPLQKFKATLKESGKKPGPEQLRKAFRKWFMEEIMKPVSTNSFFDDIEGLVAKARDDSLIVLEPSVRRIVDVGKLDIRFKTPRKNGLKYISAQILMRVEQAHWKCPKLRKQMASRTNILEDRLGCDVSVPKWFISLITVMNQTFKSFWVLKKSTKGAATELVEDLQVIDYQPYLPCKCFPTSVLRKVFVRYRIYTAIRSYNVQHKKIHFGSECMCRDHFFNTYNMK